MNGDLVARIEAGFRDLKTEMAKNQTAMARTHTDIITKIGDIKSEMAKNQTKNQTEMVKNHTDIITKIGEFETELAENRAQYQAGLTVYNYQMPPCRRASVSGD